MTSVEKPSSSPHRINAAMVAETADLLSARVRERFPDAGLSRVAEEIANTAQGAAARLEGLAKPVWPLRVVSRALLISAISLLVWAIIGGITWSDIDSRSTFSQFIGVLEPALGSVAFTTAFFLFVWSWENRYKERRVLRALNEVRSLVHVVDMHQLKKGPERALISGPDTASSPKRDLSRFELSRYLEYCSEMLSLLSKISALYAQAFPDPTVLQGVDQIELLATGLSRKIWQKLILLHGADEAPSPEPSVLS